MKGPSGGDEPRPPWPEVVYALAAILSAFHGFRNAPLATIVAGVAFVAAFVVLRGRLWRVARSGGTLPQAVSGMASGQSLTRQTSPR